MAPEVRKEWLCTLRHSRGSHQQSKSRLWAVITSPRGYRAGGGEPLPTQRAPPSSRQTACSPKTATCECFLLQAEAWLCTRRGELRHSPSPQLMACRGFGHVFLHLTPQGAPPELQGPWEKSMAWSRGSVQQAPNWSKYSLQLQSLLSQRKYPTAPGLLPAPQGCPGMEHVAQPCFPWDNCPEGNTAREWGRCGGLMCTQQNKIKSGCTATTVLYQGNI